MVTREGYWTEPDADPSNVTAQGDASTVPASYAGASSAEWIVEDPGSPVVPFPDFGTVTFSDLQCSPSTSIVSDDRVLMQPNTGSLLAAPGLPNDVGFAVSYSGS